MIVVMRKNNIILVGLILLLLATIYSLNLEKDGTVAATGDSGRTKTVILDPGHGGEDPGAVSDYSGLKEKDFNLDVAMKVKKLLEDEGYKVIMTREDDVLAYDPETREILQKRKQDLLRRKKIMDEAGADIVVSIHLNKFPENRYYGAQTFFPPGSADSQRLAACIQKCLKDMVDPTNNRVSLVKKEPIIILKDYKTTTAIVECGFLSNREEEMKLQSDEYRQKIAEAIAEGIKRYCQIMPG